MATVPIHERCCCQFADEDGPPVKLCAYHQAREKEIQRLQSLIDEHNRGMDAECENRVCEAVDSSLPAFRCEHCPRFNKIED